MNVDAYLSSGRCVASAYQKLNKAGSKLWHDTRDCGGIYVRLEEWMSIVKLEHENETVTFRMR